MPTNEQVEAVAQALRNTPKYYFSRRAMDKSCVEVVYDQDPQGPITDESFVVVQRCDEQPEASRRVAELQDELRARAALQAAEEADDTVRSKDDDEDRELVIERALIGLVSVCKDTLSKEQIGKATGLGPMTVNDLLAISEKAVLVPRDLLRDMRRWAGRVPIGYIGDENWPSFLEVLSRADFILVTGDDAAAERETKSPPSLLSVGYSHGGYYCTCRNCGSRFDGDKHAWRCRPCAEREVAARQAAERGE